jgi:hypothetical protein
MNGLDYLAEGSRWYVLLALLAAAAGKSFDFSAFRDSLARSFPSLARFHGAMAAGIVAAEWVIALALLAGGPLGRLGMLAALAMFVVFTAVIGTSIVRGRAIVCSCFGTSTHRVGHLDVVRNLVLTAAAAIALAHGMPAMPWPVELVLAGLAAIGVAASVWLRDLAWLLRAKPAN